jgi:ribosomal protein L37AE/L43A
MAEFDSDIKKYITNKDVCPGCGKKFRKGIVVWGCRNDKRYYHPACHPDAVDIYRRTVVQGS